MVCPSSDARQVNSSTYREIGTDRTTLQLPGFGKSGKTAVVGSFYLRRETASRQLLALEMIGQAVAADPLVGAAAVGTTTDIQIAFLHTFHVVFPDDDIGLRIAMGHQKLRYSFARNRPSRRNHAYVFSSSKANTDTGRKIMIGAQAAKSGSLSTGAPLPAKNLQAKVAM